MAVPSPVADRNSVLNEYFVLDTFTIPRTVGGREKGKAPGTGLKQSSYGIGRFYSPFSHRP